MKPIVAFRNIAKAPKNYIMTGFIISRTAVNETPKELSNTKREGSTYYG
jgi:hypothetical protein